MVVCLFVFVTIWSCFFVTLKKKNKSMTEVMSTHLLKTSSPAGSHGTALVTATQLRPGYQNHSLLRLEGALKVSKASKGPLGLSPCRGLMATHHLRLPSTPSCQVLNTSRDRTSVPTPHHSKCAWIQRWRKPSMSGWRFNIPNRQDQLSVAILQSRGLHYPISVMFWTPASL